MLARAMLALLVCSAPSMAWARNWNFQANATSEINAWDDNFGDEGFQAASIVALSAVNEDWRLGLSGGFIWAETSSDLPDFRGSVSTPMDTVVSASFRGLRTRIFGRELRFSIDGDVSLPTGQAQLTGREKNVVFDPLLARYDRYGEGFNYSAGLVAALALTDRLSLAIGARYTVTGAYRPNGDAPDVEIDPGDTPAMQVQLVWRSREDFLTFGLELSDEREARRDDLVLLDRGRRIELSLAGSTRLGGAWTLSGSGFYTTSRRDRRLNELTGEFVLEQSRRNGEVWAVAGALYRQVGSATAVGLEADYVSAGDSEVDQADFSYLPARRRWRAGIGLRQTVLRSVTLSAVLRYSDYRDRGSQLLLPLNAEGVNFTFGLGTTF